MNSLLEIIDCVQEEGREYLLDYFKDAPIGILNSCKKIDIPAKQIFITEKDKIEYIHILVKGSVKATDYRIFGVTYDFFWFKAVEVFGAMEAFIDEDVYMTTLMTDTPCAFILIKRSKYIRWMKHDPHALFLQSSIMTKYLLEQAKRERVFLLMQAKDRIYILFTNIYKSKNVNGICDILLSRQELSDAAGLSTKTIDRILKSLKEEELITIKNGRIRISNEQYERMEDFIRGKADL